MYSNDYCKITGPPGVGKVLSAKRVLYYHAIDSVPQAEQVACCYGDAQTNKPTKHDGGVVPLISTLHNADKASAGHPIG